MLKRLSILLLMISLHFGCKNELAEIREVLEKDLPAEIAFDVEIHYTDSSILKVRVEAPVMERQRRGVRMVEHFTDGVYAEFFDAQEQLVSWVESDRAIRNDTEKKIYLYDNVILINITGDTLMTEELIWDERAERIYNNRFFRFSNANEEIYGYRFNSNQEFTEYSFSRGAGFLNPESISGAGEN